MIIEEIHITRFGLFRDFDCTLGEGVNVIFGENESGKSTLAAFIRYMFYGFGSAPSADDVGEREKRISWESNTAEGTMTVRLQNGKRYRLERKTVAVPQAGRIGYRESSAIFDADTGKQQPFRSLPGEAFFSVPEQVYLNTAFIGLTPDLRVNEGDMNQAMENLLFSGDERVSTQRALRALKEAKDSLLHPSGVGGAIFEIRSQAENLRLRLARAMRLNVTVMQIESDLHGLRKKIADAENERNRLEEIDRNYHNYLKICTFDRLHEEENRYNEAAAELEKLRAANRNGDFLPDEKYLTNLAATERVCEISRQNYMRSAQKLEALKSEAALSPDEAELLRKTEEAGGAEKLEAEYNRMHRNQKLLRRLTVVFLVLTALFLSASAASFLFSGVSPVAALLGFLGLSLAVSTLESFGSRRRLMDRIRNQCTKFGAVSGADLLFKLRSVAGSVNAIAERESNMRRAEENLDISRQNFFAMRQNLLTEVGKWNRKLGPGSPNEAVEEISAEVRVFLDEQKRLSEIAAEYRGKVLALRNETGNESEIAIRATVTPERREALKNMSYKLVEEGLTYYRASCESLHARYNDLLERLQKNRRDAESPALLRMELSAAEEKIASMQRRYRAYTLACNAVENASARLRAEISPRLSAYLRRLMRELPGEKFDGISVGNRLLITYEDGAAERGIGAMSGSVRDLTYISLRLSLLDLLYREKPPVCFDETFCRQDGAHAAAILRAIDRAAKGNMQSILFTCHERDAELAANAAENACRIELKGASLE